MPRPLRIEYPGAWYFVKNVVSKGKKLARSDSHRSLFLSLLSDTCELHGMTCHAFVLLDKSFYLIVHTPLGNVSHAIRHLNSVYTQRFNTHTGQTGPLFKGRFKSVLFDKDTYLLRISRYLHQLPSLKKLVIFPASYTWSSYASYIGKSSQHPALTKKVLLSYLGSAQPELDYRSFVENIYDADMAKWFSSKKLKPILGSASFVASIQIFQVAQPAPPSHPSMDILIKSASSVLNDPLDNILISKRGRNNKQLGRTVAMYLCRHIGQYPIKAIAAHFNVTHESAVSVRLSRFQKSLSNDPKLQLKLKLLKQTIGKFQVDNP